jgi:hypothetical protein
MQPDHAAPVVIEVASHGVANGLAEVVDGVGLGEDVRTKRARSSRLRRRPRPGK